MLVTNMLHTCVDYYTGKSLGNHIITERDN